MSRRLATAIEIGAALAATVYILVATVQMPDAPAVHVGQLAVDVLLAFAAFVMALLLFIAARQGIPPLLARWRQWRTVRRSIRHRARRWPRQMRHRRASRIGARP